MYIYYFYRQNNTYGSFNVTMFYCYAVCPKRYLTDNEIRKKVKSAEYDF